MTDKRIAAILFDLDGVLIDSPAAHARAWAELFRPFGLVLPPERLHREEGRRSLEIARGIIAEYGLPIDDSELERLLASKREYYRSIAPRGLRKDAQAAVRDARARGLKVGLVSGSARENVVAALDQTEFDVIVTAEDYETGKPDPEPYLTACRQLGVAPEACMAVENAPLGVASARAAGLQVIALTSTLPRELLIGADWIIDDIREVGGILKANLERVDR